MCTDTAWIQGLAVIKHSATGASVRRTFFYYLIIHRRTAPFVRPEFRVEYAEVSRKLYLQPLLHFNGVQKSIGWRVIKPMHKYCVSTDTAASTHLHPTHIQVCNTPQSVLPLIPLWTFLNFHFNDSYCEPNGTPSAPSWWLEPKTRTTVNSKCKPFVRNDN